MQNEELLNIKLQNADTIIILSGSDLSGITLPDNKTVVEDCCMFTPVVFNAAWQSFDIVSYAKKHHNGDNKRAYNEFCKYMEDAKEINRDEYFSFSLVPQKFFVVIKVLKNVNLLRMRDKTCTFAAKPVNMLLKDFFSRFPDEESCVSYFKEIRQSVGVTCPKCGGTVHTWLNCRGEFQCKKCGCRTSLTKGTVMESSRLSMYAWFFTAHLMTSFKQVLSAKEIQHQLEMKEYPPVWLMMMKLRDIMGKRDAVYKLSDQIELDVSYFPTTVFAEGGGEKALDTKKTTVLVIAESKAVDEILPEYLSNIADNESINKASRLIRKAEKRSVKKAVHYIKMFAVPNQQFETIKPFVVASIDKDAKAVTDGGKSLFRLKELLKTHEAHQETEGGAHEVVVNILPWVHIVTGECRSGIEAIHKEVDERFLQLYLNEYCWKFNRRFFRDSKDPKYDLFDHLIKTAATYTSDIKWRDYAGGGKAVDIL